MSTPETPRPGAPVRAPIFDGSAGDEVREELAFHLEMRTREYLAQGLPELEARRRAEAHFPDLPGVRRTMHDLADRRGRRTRRSRFLADLVEDLRFTRRMLWRRRAVTLLAIVTTALGIGAATAIYSVLDHVMLRPLPFQRPEELVAVWNADEGFRDNSVTASWWDHVVMGQEDYLALQPARTLRDLGFWSFSRGSLATADGPTPVFRYTITAGLLQTLRIRPILGRGFEATENVLNGPRVAMLSSELWQQQYGRDSAIIGRTVQVGRREYSVVGVLPPGLRLDRTQSGPSIWVPAFQDSSDLVERHNRNYRAIARLAPGATLDQARQEAVALLRPLSASPAKVGATVQHWQIDQTRNVRGSLWILFGAGGLLLLIACVNVAVLMLGEAALRRQEMASRAAIGATPGRLARQLLTESTAIAVLGAVAGVGVAWLALKGMVASAPVVMPGLDQVRLDLRVLGFAAACAIGTGILFGIGPALAMVRRGSSLFRLGLGQSLRHGNRVQRGLIALEIALSLVLVAGCLLLGRSLHLLANVAPGFDTDRILVAQFRPGAAFFDDDGRMITLLDAVQREFAGLPGVVSAAVAGDVPFAVGGSNSPVRIEGVEYDDDNRPPRSTQRAVMPGFFGALGIPLRAGRDFAATDAPGSAPVIIVNEAEARRDWPGASPIGKRLHWQGQWRLVIGVVGDFRAGTLDAEPEPAVFVPVTQYTYGNFSVVLRMGSDRFPEAALIRDRLQAIDPSITLQSADPVARLLSASYEQQSYRTTLASLFGILAGLLAAVGVYGVIARAVAQRAREAGIRVALGATPGTVSRLMVRDAMTAIAAGLVVGLPLALLTGRLLAPYLFRITAHDPVAIGLSLTLLVGTGLLAAIPPARRAGRVDPVVVLRGE